LKAWAESLEGINYPLLSDFWPHGKVSNEYGVLRSDGTSERAIFIIDKGGIIQYIDIHDIDEQPSNEEIRKVLREIEPSAARFDTTDPFEEPPPLPQGGIVMYCTSWCPDCKKAIRWFEERDLKFKSVDITRVPGAAEKVMSWADGNRTTPTFDIDGSVIVDWDESTLIKTLQLKGYL
jgi:glutaredoxin